MIEDYEILEPIGKGSFGLVRKIKRKTDGRTLVWKELNYGQMNEKERQQIVAEVNILWNLRHAHIVRYYNRIIDRKTQMIYIVMEYCAEGDLGQIIKKCAKQKDYIPEEFVWKIFAQIVSALFACHRRSQSTQINSGESATNQSTTSTSQAAATEKDIDNPNTSTTLSNSLENQGQQQRPQKILHRDLKPGNIFLDANQNVKLGDFGLARVMNHDSMFAQTNVGTPYYMSPEQIQEKMYNEKSDIWSLGCLVYEMAALHPPFKAQNPISLALKIKEAQFERIPDRYSEDLWRVIKAMMQVSQKRRACIDDLVQVPNLRPFLSGQSNPRLDLASLEERSARLVREATRLQEKEHALKKREVEFEKRACLIREKEQFLNGQEERVIQRERDLAIVEEKEKLIFQILQKAHLPVIKGNLQATLQAIEKGSSGSTAGTCASVRGSFSHKLKDESKQCSESLSPLKSGVFLSTSKDQTLQMQLNRLPAASISHNDARQPGVTSSQQLPRGCTAPTTHYSTQQKGKTLLKNNKSDPNMRTFTIDEEVQDETTTQAAAAQINTSKVAIDQFKEKQLEGEKVQKSLEKKQQKSAADLQKNTTTQPQQKERSCGVAKIAHNSQQQPQKEQKQHQALRHSTESAIPLLASKGSPLTNQAQLPKTTTSSSAQALLAEAGSPLEQLMNYRRSKQQQILQLRSSEEQDKQSGSQVVGQNQLQSQKQKDWHQQERQETTRQQADFTEEQALLAQQKQKQQPVQNNSYQQAQESQQIQQEDETIEQLDCVPVGEEFPPGTRNNFSQQPQQKEVIYLGTQQASDSQFRQTTFNPNQDNPSKLMSPKQQGSNKMRQLHQNLMAVPNNANTNQPQSNQSIAATYDSIKASFEGRTSSAISFVQTMQKQRSQGAPPCPQQQQKQASLNLLNQGEGGGSSTTTTNQLASYRQSEQVVFSPPFSCKVNQNHSQQTNFQQAATLCKSQENNMNQLAVQTSKKNNRWSKEEEASDAMQQEPPPNVLQLERQRSTGGTRHQRQHSSSTTNSSANKLQLLLTSTKQTQLQPQPQPNTTSCHNNNNNYNQPETNIVRGPVGRGDDGQSDTLMPPLEVVNLSAQYATNQPQISKQNHSHLKMLSSTDANMQKQQQCRYRHPAQNQQNFTFQTHHREAPDPDQNTVGNTAAGGGDSWKQQTLSHVNQSLQQVLKQVQMPMSTRKPSLQNLLTVSTPRGADGQLAAVSGTETTHKNTLKKEGSADGFKYSQGKINSSTNSQKQAPSAFYFGPEMTQNVGEALHGQKQSTINMSFDAVSQQIAQHTSSLKKQRMHSTQDVSRFTEQTIMTARESQSGLSRTLLKQSKGQSTGVPKKESSVPSVPARFGRNQHYSMKANQQLLHEVAVQQGQQPPSSIASSITSFYPQNHQQIQRRNTEVVQPQSQRQQFSLNQNQPSNCTTTQGTLTSSEKVKKQSADGRKNQVNNSSKSGLLDLELRPIQGHYGTLTRQFSLNLTGVGDGEGVHPTIIGGLGQQIMMPQSCSNKTNKNATCTSIDQSQYESCPSYAAVAQKPPTQKSYIQLQQPPQSSQQYQANRQQIVVRPKEELTSLQQAHQQFANQQQRVKEHQKMLQQQQQQMKHHQLLANQLLQNDQQTITTMARTDQQSLKTQQKKLQKVNSVQCMSSHQQLGLQGVGHQSKQQAAQKQLQYAQRNNYLQR